MLGVRASSREGFVWQGRGPIAVKLIEQLPIWIPLQTAVNDKTDKQEL